MIFDLVRYYQGDDSSNNQYVYRRKWDTFLAPFMAGTSFMGAGVFIPIGWKGLALDKLDGTRRIQEPMESIIVIKA